MIVFGVFIGIESFYFYMIFGWIAILLIFNLVKRAKLSVVGIVFYADYLLVKANLSKYDQKVYFDKGELYLKEDFFRIISNTYYVQINRSDWDNYDLILENAKKLMKVSKRDSNHFKDLIHLILPWL